MSRQSEIEAAARDTLEKWQGLATYGMRTMHASADVLRAALALPADSETCVWTDDGCCWITGCGFSTPAETATPARIGMIFCPNCGKRIEVVDDHTEDGEA